MIYLWKLEGGLVRVDLKKFKEAFDISNLVVNIEEKVKSYIDSDEEFFFYQEDVVWYELNKFKNLWEDKAAGTLYLTQKN